jgi:DNA-binding GntR family transcriptional regulator
MIRAKKKLRPADVAEQLRCDILAGRLAPGQRLTELELCDRFEVGRGRVREAIQQLVQQGLLVTRANCGAAVAPDAPKEIQDFVVTIRRMVETFALEAIFDDLADADFKRWEKILVEMREACQRGDHAAIAEADLGFHRLILERAGFADLILIWDTILGRIRSRFLQSQWKLPRLLDIYDEHRQILNVFRAGNRAAAVRVLTRWIE